MQNMSEDERRDHILSMFRSANSWAMGTGTALAKMTVTSEDTKGPGKVFSLVTPYNVQQQLAFFSFAHRIPIEIPAPQLHICLRLGSELRRVCTLHLAACLRIQAGGRSRPT